MKVPVNARCSSEQVGSATEEQIKQSDQASAASKQRMEQTALSKHKMMKKVAHSWAHYNMKGTDRCSQWQQAGRQQAGGRRPAVATGADVMYMQSKQSNGTFWNYE